MIETARRWESVLDIDPADEQAHRALMQRALDAGNRRAAVRQFQRLREHLRADLGVGPDAGVRVPLRTSARHPRLAHQPSEQRPAGRVNSLVQAAKARARGYRTKKNMITMIYLTAAKLPLPTVADPAPVYASAAG